MPRMPFNRRKFVNNNRGKGLVRRYGFFECSKCDKAWESSHVYCQRDTETVAYKQDCKACGTACLPYRTEKITCSLCGLSTCICTDEDLELKRNTDPSKPHRSELCHKCRAGKPCYSS